MLDERKAAILEAVVSEYVNTAQPVGSAHIVNSPGINVSAATVRNEMSALEHDGYLVQPHTSAGRVPTDRGYRFFVDRLSGRSALDPSEQLKVKDFFSTAHREIEQMLADTSSLLSQLTNLAAVVTGPGTESATIKLIQLVGLSTRVALVVIVLSSGAVEKHTIDLSDEISDNKLNAASVHLTSAMRGQFLGAQPPVPATGDVVIDGAVAAAVKAMAGAHGGPERVFVGGASRMALAFDAVDTVRSVLGILEESYVVVTLLKDLADRGLDVAIGTEHGVEPLAECALVIAPYEVEGAQLGTIGVLGPTRMNYPQALAAVAVVSQRLGRHLAED